MKDYQVTLQDTIERPWLAMEPIVARPRGVKRGTLVKYALIEKKGQPLARVDVFTEYQVGPFTDGIAWGDWIAVGIADSVLLIDPESGQINDIPCDGYFGHLYPSTDRLLVASATQLICLDGRGKIVWRRDDLGIDGVVVNSIGKDAIEGEGEWDPPGGWRPFRLSLATGLSLQA